MCLSELINDNADDAIYCISEAKKSGNPPIIKNYVLAAKKNLDRIIKALDYEV